MPRITTACTALMAAILLCGPAFPQEMQFFRIGTGSTESSNFKIGSSIVDAIAHPPGSPPCDAGKTCGVPGLVAIAQSTRGAALNVHRVQTGGVEAGVTDAATLDAALTGTGPFKGEPADGLRVVTTLPSATLYLVLPGASPLAGLANLRGKRVGIGQDGSGTQVVAEQVLAALGITRDHYKEALLGSVQSAQRVTTGALDAYFTDEISHLGTKTDLRLHDWTAAELETGIAAVPQSSRVVIPADSASGTDGDIKTLAIARLLITHADQSEDLIHAITRALWSARGRELLVSQDRSGSRPAHATTTLRLEQLDAPLHPGAKRYYVEAGLLR
ncbi:TAXI family TRAP transporter solute-binding subunit [uncultured Roseovarius sp.]|uniref:TAXI family TRAP transporter solute-binding subunit n=1 Tax=uncultured Roseovarius sp. TaxID=293344 RepID=UPI002628300E|nr:TAXI family TRAP transporter solute-binding subunit [uncultured Roseovarius sp.]